MSNKAKTKAMMAFKLVQAYQKMAEVSDLWNELGADDEEFCEDYPKSFPSFDDLVAMLGTWVTSDAQRYILQDYEVPGSKKVFLNQRGLFTKIDQSLIDECK